jgi:hypothetical protein
MTAALDIIIIIIIIIIIAAAAAAAPPAAVVVILSRLDWYERLKKSFLNKDRKASKDKFLVIKDREEWYLC